MQHDHVDLEAVKERLSRATPGPWFVRFLDDEQAMNLVAISTRPDTGRGERWPEFDHHEIVAATLVQAPRYVDILDDKWDENAHFIAHARTDIEGLIREVEYLRGILDAIEPHFAPRH